MQRLHARYPFLEAAREAVADASVDLATVVAEEPAVVERARDRVVTALEEGTTGSPARTARTELLSYPVARVLVSLVDERVLVRKYARAEAHDAHERFRTELERDASLRSTGGDALRLDGLLAEFDLTGAVSKRRPTTRAGAGQRGAGASGRRAVPEEGAYAVEVTTYIRLAADLWGDEWRLVNRALADGAVPVTEDELSVLLREAVRQRVEAGLPLTVPEEVARHLERHVAEIREVLAELELTREIDTVVPELFPPCMTALLDGIQRGEHLEHHSRFAITAFLTSIGMSTDDIVELYMVNSSFGEEMTRYQTDHIRGDTSPTQYSPPSCATMQSYGDCVNMDDLCERISHPMAYYERRLDEAEDDEVEDWRDRTEAERENEADTA